ncbi:F-box/LRR-repeat protein 2 [Hondaea fermentalgiana]|uniref:F-box/LRR-repeat protein 2 n=1 Tax=Hondaea fermentalgiana TaxID=2315210 RepID=A0A2R5GAN2_9STRA|nr:F-box/LRR-repeat protein 2 [Hondaea fermentalgiana]|eukprot:GBG25603.1 F-box/LRR-repeat protein 2 [Hondaea fermentalgiana]
MTQVLIKMKVKAKMRSDKIREEEEERQQQQQQQQQRLRRRRQQRSSNGTKEPGPQRQRGGQENAMEAGAKRTADRTAAAPAPHRKRQRLESAGAERARDLDGPQSISGRLPSSVLSTILGDFIGDAQILPLRAADRADKEACTQFLVKRSLLRAKTPNASEKSNNNNDKQIESWAKTLDHIVIDQDTEVSDADLCRIASKCPQLRSFTALRCAKVSAHGLKMFFGLSRKLESVHLEHCTHLDAPTLARLAEKCSDLRSLHVSHCPKLDPSCIRVLVQQCNLEKLVIRHCQDVSSDAVADLQKTSMRLGLRELNLEGCTALDDNALRSIALACPELEILTLSGIKSISDRAFAALAKNCPRLRRLEARDCSGVGSVGIALVLQLCKTLEHLEVAGTNIADICFLSLGPQRARPLSYLGLERCRALSASGLRAALERFPLATVRSSPHHGDLKNAEDSQGDHSPNSETSSMSTSTDAWASAQESSLAASVLASLKTNVPSCGPTSEKVASPVKHTPSRPLASLARPPLLSKLHWRGQVRRHKDHSRRLSTRAMIMQQLIASTHLSMQSDSEASEAFV